MVFCSTSNSLINSQRVKGFTRLTVLCHQETVMSFSFLTVCMCLCPGCGSDAGASSAAGRAGRLPAGAG